MKKVTTLTAKIAAIAAFITILNAAPPVKCEELRAPIQAALDAGDTTKAINLLKEEIKIDPGFHYNYYILGRIHYNWMQYDKALRQFEIALDKKKKHYESLYYYGLTNLKMDKIKEAEKAMEEGLKKASHLKAWFENGFGLVQIAKKNYTEADRAFRRALAIEPNNPDYHINLGDANFYEGIPALAVLEYEQALKADTGSLEVYYHWAEACLEMKDYNCAIEKLKLVLDADSTHAPAWMRAGSIYYKAARSATSRPDQIARFKEAIGSYKKYIELANATADSSSVRAFFDLAMSYFGLNGFEDAAKYFEEVLAIPYEPRDVYFYYGKSLWGMKSYAKSAEVLQKHLKWLEDQDSDYKSTASLEEVYRLIGDAYFYSKPRQFVKALSWYSKSLDINPEQKRILYNIAVAYHTGKSYVQAIDYYEKRIALGIDSSEANIYKNAGFCALNLANSDGGGDELDIDLEEDLGNGEVIEDVGTESSPGDVDYYQLALEFMSKYYEFDSKDAKVVSLIANTYLYQMSECTNGVKWFGRLLELEPGNCDAKKALGFAYFGGNCTKNFSKALGYLTDAHACIAKQSGECKDGELTMWIAQCYHLRGADQIAAKKDATEDFKKAYEWYGKVLKCEPGNTIAKKGQDDLKFEF